VKSRFLGLALAAGLVGCGSGGSSGAASTTVPGTTGVAAAPTTSANLVAAPAAPLATAPVTSRAGAWLKGDLHVHSTYSGDATTIGDDVTGVFRAAESAGLDFIAVTDHRNSSCLTDPAFLAAQTKLILLAGEEWGQPGHAGTLGLTRAPVSDTQDETQGAAIAVQKIQAVVDDVHSMGGLFVLNHPIDASIPWNWPVDRFDGLEAWNQSWAFRSSTDVALADVQAWATNHGFGQPGGPTVPPEVLAAVSVQGGGQNRQRLTLFDAHLSAGRHIAATGGGDSHYIVLPGGPTTVVFAEQSTPAGILAAIKGGRTVVQRAPDAPWVELTADSTGSGVFDAMVGDRIPLGRAVTFQIHVKDALDGKLQLVKNGSVLETWAITSPDFTVQLTDTPATASYYRVNCLEKIDPTVPKGDLLQQLVRGTATIPWLPALVSSGALGGGVTSFLSKAQVLVNAGGPVVVWLIVYGPQAGVTISPAPTAYPRLVFPRGVSQILNMALDDPGYCMSSLTSPIWVE
jgi:hypothetical protein